MRACRVFALAALSARLLTGGSARGEEPPRVTAPDGMEYELRELAEPRPNRVHILRVDLTRGDLRPAVAIGPDPDGEGPAEATLTNPLTLADDPAVVAFVNTNPWDAIPDAEGNRNRSWYEGQPVDVHGLAMTADRTGSPVEEGYPSVWIDGRGHVRMGTGPAESGCEGVAGFQPIVRAGELAQEPGGPMHPRTAVGTDREGTTLWLVVVDGRQKGFSEGMTLHELGGVMRDLGCFEATNVDGGGSSVMGLADATGALRVVNSPSDRTLGLIPKVRPVPVILTLRKQPKP